MHHAACLMVVSVMWLSGRERFVHLLRTHRQLQLVVEEAQEIRHETDELGQPISVMLFRTLLGGDTVGLKAP